MGILSDLFDPGRKQRKASNQNAVMGVFDGLSADGPGGIFARSGFDPATGRMNETSFGLGQFENPFQQLLGSAGQSLRGAQGGLPAGIQQALQQSSQTLSGGAPQQIRNASNFNDLGSVFQSALPLAGANPFDLGAGVTGALRGRAQRGNQNLVNQTFDRLFQSGGLANSATREQVTGDLRRQLSDEDLGFQLAGLEAGRGIQQDALGRLFGAVQGREGIAGRNFSEGLASRQLLSQNALQRFGLFSEANRLQQGNRALSQNLGLQALQGAAGLSTLPLAFQNAALASSGLRSQSLGQLSGVQAQNSANTQSPLLEGLNAVGTIAGNLGLGFGGGAAAAAAPAVSSPVNVGGVNVGAAFRGVDPFRNMFGGI